MRRFSGVVLCLIAMMTLGAKPQNEMFSKYKAVEAYEIEPGILAMPKYSSDGQVCEIGLEKRLYSPESVRLETNFSDQEIDHLVDDLVPSDMRGPKSGGFEAGRKQTIITNISYSEIVADYANVTVQAEGYFSFVPKQKVATQNNPVIIIRWNNRKCQ
jgi:hypothetical protein